MEPGGRAANPQLAAYSHNFLAKIALEVCGGLFVPQVLDQLKPRHLPAEIRVQAVDRPAAHDCVPGSVLQAGCPLEMPTGSLAACRDTPDP